MIISKLACKRKRIIMLHQEVQYPIMMTLQTGCLSLSVTLKLFLVLNLMLWVKLALKRFARIIICHMIMLMNKLSNTYHVDKYINADMLRKYAVYDLHNLPWYPKKQHLDRHCYGHFFATILIDEISVFHNTPKWP